MGTLTQKTKDQLAEFLRIYGNQLPNHMQSSFVLDTASLLGMVTVDVVDSTFDKIHKRLGE